MYDLTNPIRLKTNDSYRCLAIALNSVDGEARILRSSDNRFHQNTPLVQRSRSVLSTDFQDHWEKTHPEKYSLHKELWKTHLHPSEVDQEGGNPQVKGPAPALRSSSASTRPRRQSRPEGRARVQSRPIFCSKSLGRLPELWLLSFIYLHMTVFQRPRG